MPDTTRSDWHRDGIRAAAGASTVTPTAVRESSRRVNLSEGVPGNPARFRGVGKEAIGEGLARARSLFLRPAFAVVFSVLRLARPLGPPWFLKMLAHPQWLFEGNVAIPHRPVALFAPSCRDQAQIELCARICNAYGAANGEHADLSAIWSGKLLRYYAPLDRALASGDPIALNEQLRWMFRRPFLSGISTPIDYEDPGAPWTWSLMTYNSLVSLGEAVGAIRVETPEQGIVGRVFSEGLDQLPARIEAELGVSLDFPRVGAPYGTMIGGRLIIRETGRHLGAAMRIHNAAKQYLGTRPNNGYHVLEIGGGFGGAAMWYLRLLGENPGSYTIVDLPLMNAVQAYFLGNVYGAEAVRLHGEEADASRITVVPPQFLSESAPRADIVFNQDSMAEMTESAARGYLAWAQSSGSGLFVSCNQEVGTYRGVTQQVVAELVSDFSGITPISRDPSWTRPGYVEEVYRCSASVSQE